MMERAMNAAFTVLGSVITFAVTFGYAPLPWMSRGETLLLGSLIFVYGSLCYRIDRSPAL